MVNNVEKYIIFRLEDLDLKKILRNIKEDKVVLIQVNTEVMDLSYIDIKILNKQDKNRIKKLRVQNDKINFYITHSIVNIIFSEILNKNMNEIVWKEKKYHKPYIENPLGICFNISHTNGYAIVSIYKNEIGADVEKTDGNEDYINIAKTILSKSEMKLLNDNLIRFYYIWTAKEAYLKFIGSGFMVEPKKVNVVEIENNMITIFSKLENEYKIIVNYKIDDNYVVSLCF